MKPICIFDVNETLLDLTVLDPLFEKTFGDTTFRKVWFSQFIHSAFVTIITDQYKDFGIIGKGALEMLAEKQDITLSEDQKMEILSTIKNLPPHPEVASSLKKLKNAGYKLATLTNSKKEIAITQMKNAKLTQYFDQIISADEVKRLKPAKEPYMFAAKKFNVKIENIILIASHAWDIAGATNAGCKTAFIARPGMVLDPLYPKPDIIGKNLEDVVNTIFTKYK